MSTALISPSVQHILAGVRLVLRQPDPNNSNWSDEELLMHMNEAVRVYSVELGFINEGHGATTANLDIVSGVEAIPLPSTCFQIKNLWRKQGTSYLTLNYINDLTHGYSTAGSSGGSGYLPNYSLRGNSIILNPTPNFSETAGLRIEFTSYPAILVDSSDQLPASISPIFWQVVQAYVVYMAKHTESLVSGVNTASVAKDHLSDLTEQFRKLNVKRSKNPTFVEPFDI